MTYYGIWGFSWLVSWFSLPTLDTLARQISYVAYSWLGIRRRTVRANLRTAFGSAMTTREIDQLARTSLYHFLLTIFEFLHERRGRLADQVRLEGREHLDHALAKGQGVYVLCMHLGSWEAMGGAISQQLRPAHVIVKKVGPPGINRFVEEQRQRNQFHFIKRQKKGDGFRQIQEVLGRGEIVGFVIDQARPGEPQLPFFGKPAKTNTSFAAIWRRHPAPIVPAYIVREGVGRHCVRIKPELELQLTEDAKRDILEHSQVFNRVVETCIKECPEQYFWMHDRWK